MLRIGASGCLLGHPVRYDGGHKRHRTVTETLSRYFEIISVCPEMEVGMGVPREPVDLIGDPLAPRMIGRRSGRDWSQTMQRHGRRRAAELERLGICGFVLKTGSPSCAPAGVPVRAPRREAPVAAPQDAMPARTPSLDTAPTPPAASLGTTDLDAPTSAFPGAPTPKFPDAPTAKFPDATGLDLPTAPTAGANRLDAPTATAPGTAAGLFAWALREALPLLPLETEDRLDNAAVCGNFIERVHGYRDWRECAAEGPSASRLQDFHASHKFTLLAHSERHLRLLGRLLAEAGNASPEEVTTRYGSTFMEALRQPATRETRTNALQHLAGFLSARLDRHSRQRLAHMVHDYRLGRVPLSAPATRIRRHAAEHQIGYVLRQSFLRTPAARDPHR